MSTAVSESERARRRQFAVNSRTALALGVSLGALTAARKAAIESWTASIRARMKECGAHDPIEILPELLTLVEEHVVGEARAAAKAAAREEVQRMLRKAVSP
jgi:hypothetical protein